MKKNQNTAYLDKYIRIVSSYRNFIRVMKSSPSTIVVLKERKKCFITCKLTLGLVIEPSFSMEYPLQGISHNYILRPLLLYSAYLSLHQSCALL